MDDVVSTFPLLRLPINAILNTLKTTEYPQIIGISLLSKKTRNLVQSLKITTSKFGIIVCESFNVRLSFYNHFWIDFELYRVRENEPLQELGTPANLNIQYGNTKVEWTNSMSVNELLDHFQFIFHSSITLLYFGFDAERFSVESIHRNVKKMDRINIYSNNDEQSRRILSLFRPATFDIGDSALSDRCVPKDVLIQNLELIRVHHAHITLDEFLITNARGIDITCRRFSVKTLNRFLNLWAQGSNLRMEGLFLRFYDTLKIEELFRGLNYKMAPPRRRRYFENAGLNASERVTGGWDFWRFDGTEATITLCPNGGFIIFCMFVWHDHCVGNQTDL